MGDCGWLTGNVDKTIGSRECPKLWQYTTFNRDHDEIRILTMELTGICLRRISSCSVDVKHGRWWQWNKVLPSFSRWSEETRWGGHFLQRSSELNAAKFDEHNHMLNSELNVVTFNRILTWWQVGPAYSRLINQLSTSMIAPYSHCITNPALLAEHGKF